MRRNDHSYIHLFPSDISKKGEKHNQRVKKRKDSLESDEDGIEPDTVIDDLVSTRIMIYVGQCILIMGTCTG